MLRANVHVTSPDLVLSETRETVPEMRFEVAYQSVSNVIFLTVEGEDFERLTRAMDEDDTVAGYERSAEYANRRVYKVTLDMDRRVISEVAAQLGISITKTTSEPDDVGWTFEMLIPDREALVDLREFCVEHGLDFRLDRLFYSEEARKEGGEYGLTEKQRETLLTAFENGYFDVPRGVSQQELAEALQTSPTAVSQRIRRAITQLIGNTVGNDENEES